MGVDNKTLTLPDAETALNLAAQNNYNLQKAKHVQKEEEFKNENARRDEWFQQMFYSIPQKILDAIDKGYTSIEIQLDYYSTLSDTHHKMLRDYLYPLKYVYYINTRRHTDDMKAGEAARVRHQLGCKKEFRNCYKYYFLNIDWGKETKCCIL